MKMNRQGCGSAGSEDGLAPFIKKIGKGPKLAEDLTQPEALHAMDIILSGNATPAQIGAFLLAARIKGESIDETAGLLLGLRKHSLRLPTPPVPRLIELSCAHDGKNKSVNLTPFVARALNQIGLAVILTGGENIPTKAGVTSGQLTRVLGWPQNLSGQEVASQLQSKGFAYWDMKNICPALENLKELRRSLGLRTVFNTLEKLINPAHATHLVTGIFHGPYLKVVTESLKKVGEQNILCVQATEASTDLPLKKRVLYRELHNGILSEQLEFDPQVWGLKQPENPAFNEVSAEDVLRQVRDAIQLQRGLVYDALLYNIAVILYWLRITDNVKSSLDKARPLINENLLFV